MSFRIDYLRFYIQPGFDKLSQIFIACLKKEPLRMPFPLHCDNSLVEVASGDAHHDDIFHQRTRLLTLQPGSNCSKEEMIRPGNHWSPSMQTTGTVVNKDILLLDQETRISPTACLNVQQPVHHEDEENLSQYAQQAENELLHDAAGNEEFEEYDNSEAQDSGMTIHIRCPTAEQISKNKVAIAQGSGAYHNMILPLFQQLTNVADTDPLFI